MGAADQATGRRAARAARVDPSPRPDTQHRPDEVLATDRRRDARPQSRRGTRREGPRADRRDRGRAAAPDEWELGPRLLVDQVEQAGPVHTVDLTRVTRATAAPAVPPTTRLAPPSQRRSATVSGAGRRAERAERAATKRTRRMRLAAASTVAVLAVSGITALLLDRRGDSDALTSLAQAPSSSLPAADPSASSPVVTMLGGPTPSGVPTPSGTPSPGASAKASPKASAKTTAKAKPRTTAPKATTLGRSGVVLDGRTMGGWYAGAGGTGVADGGFASWLGQPLQIVSTWADGDDEVQRTVSGLTANYSNWKGAIDVAVGGTVLGSGENYAAAASGAYDARWRESARVIASVRKGKGPTFLRPFHEFNGTWFAEWSINSGNVGDFRTAFRRYAQILREALPEAYIVWCPNSGDHSGVPVESYYPGDDVVDVVAPDYYHDGYSEDPSSTSWRNGSPLGMDAWRQFAAKHGKPLGVPEWGLKAEGGGDSPEWIKAFNSWATKHANTATWQIGAKIPSSAAGKVLYTSYFNVVHGGDAEFTIYGHGANPQSAAAYRSLRWGNVG